MTHVQYGGVYFVSFYMNLLRRGTTETFQKLSVVARKRSVVKWLEPCPWLNSSSYSKQKWWQTYTWLFDVILRLSDALVCFRASGANFLRSITRAIVNKNDGKRRNDEINQRSIRASFGRHLGIIWRSLWDHVDVIWGSSGTIWGSSGTIWGSSGHHLGIIWGPFESNGSE